MEDILIFFLNFLDTNFLLASNFLIIINYILKILLKLKNNFINLIRVNSPSKISSFCLRSIIYANENGRIHPIDKSKINYHAIYENNFQIMPDQRTIIGVQHGNGNRFLIMENIQNKDNNYTPYKFGNHASIINTILPNWKFTTIYVGDQTGKVIQYEFNHSSRTWFYARNYGDLQIGGVLTSIRFGNIAIFGGAYNYKIRTIDMDKEEMVLNSYKVAIYNVYSLILCPISYKDIRMVVTGNAPLYSQTQSYDLDLDQ